MYRGLVSAKPFARKRKKYSLKKMMNQTGIPMPAISLNISQKAKEILSRTVIATILLVCWFIFLIRGVFFKAEFRMEQVKRSEHTIETFEDIDLFNIIAKEIKGQNYYMLNAFEKKNILAKAQTSFPFVHELHFQLETGHTLGIDVGFTEPIFKVKLGEKEFWIWGENLFFEIKSGLNLGKESFVIDTPQYLTGTTSLSGFFFDISIKNFTNLIAIMQTELPTMNRFVYLAGSTRLAIFTENEQVIYFNFRDPENLQEQFEKYHTLQEHYEKFQNIASIDLGSLDKNKVIIRKK